MHGRGLSFSYQLLLALTLIVGAGVLAPAAAENELSAAAEKEPSAVAENESSTVVPPAGIFVSSGPRVSDKVLSSPFVQGNLIRVGWDEVEPAPGQYDFSAIDKLISQAKQHNKRVALSVLNGPRAPAWLYEAGAKSFVYEFKTRYSERGDRQERIPLPWDAVYLQHWRALSAALGKRYQDEKSIALVHITHSSKNGFEMQLPEQRINGRRESVTHGPWHDAGYAVEKHIAAMQSVIDAYVKAFPSTPLDIEIHPVLDSYKPAEAVLEYGQQQAGERFGLFSAWWSGKSERWNAPLYPLLEKACDTSFCTLQLIGNQTRQPERLLKGSVNETIDAGMELGAKYFEVWDVDVRNRELKASLTNIAGQLNKP